MEVLQSRTDVFREQSFKIADLVEEPEDDSKVEIKRVITKSGTVIRYMKNGDLQALYADGDFSVNNTRKKDLETTEFTGKYLCNF